MAVLARPQLDGSFDVTERLWPKIGYREWVDSRRLIKRRRYLRQRPSASAFGSFLASNAGRLDSAATSDIQELMSSNGSSGDNSGHWSSIIRAAGNRRESTLQRRRLFRKTAIHFSRLMTSSLRAPGFSRGDSKHRNSPWPGAGMQVIAWLCRY
jgi:hypothetical protein